MRQAPKDFRVRRPDGRGGWLWNLNGIERIPYRLPEMLRAIERGETVFVCEGEKDADALAALGFCATTNAGGANWTWTQAFADHFRCVPSVVHLPDCDEGDGNLLSKGREAARDRGALTRTVVGDVRIVDLAPDRHDGYDVSDWLADGHTADDLRAWSHKLAVSTPRHRRTEKFTPRNRKNP